MPFIDDIFDDAYCETLLNVARSIEEGSLEVSILAALRRKLGLQIIDEMRFWGVPKKLREKFSRLDVDSLCNLRAPETLVNHESQVDSIFTQCLEQLADFEREVIALHIDGLSRKKIALQTCNSRYRIDCIFKKAQRILERLAGAV